MSTATTHIDNKPSLRGTKQSHPLVPALRFKEFCREWNEILLDDFAQRGSGHTPSKSFPEYYNGDINWISLTDSKRLDNGFIEETNSKITQKGIDNSSAVLHPAGTVLLSRDAGVGKSAVMKHSMAVSQHFIVWRTQDDKSSNWFLYNWLQIMKPHFERMAVGNTIKTIGLPYFKKLKIVTPQYTEQQKIASFLSAVDEKIQQLTKKKALLEQYKKGVMQQLFSGQLRFKDENGKEYPDWEEKRLLEFCTFFSGGTPSSTNKKFYSGTIPFIGSGNIYDSEVFNFISEEALNSSSAKIVEEGDLLYALYGANSGEVAISQLEGAINQAILCIRTKESIEYLYYLLLGNKDNIVAKYLQGGQGNLSAQIIKKLKYKFPSIEEQQKIASYLWRIDTKIESVNNQITQTQTFKKGLLQQLFI